MSPTERSAPERKTRMSRRRHSAIALNASAVEAARGTVEIIFLYRNKSIVRGAALEWAMSFAIPPPIEPMLAKAADTVPSAGDFLFEPKWDGFRAIVFRGSDDEVFIQSRDLRPLDRYFPELH